MRLAASAFSVALAGLMLTACASSGASPSSADTPGSNPGAGGPAAVTVTAKSGPLGDHLTDGSGRTLYLFTADGAGTSKCSGACASYWPPLTTSGMPAAGDGVDASKLGVITRDDGSAQVIYNGHPLYYYASDAAPGDATGQGLNLSGGLWWVVSPGGDAVQSAAPTSAGSDPGYDYGG